MLGSTEQIKFEATNQDICMMCHFSSECDLCCSKCKDKCNTQQQCRIGKKDQAERLIAWRHIINGSNSFNRLIVYAHNRKVG